MLKVTTLTVTRGDRPEMLANMRRLMSNQSYQPHGMVVMDDEPLSNKKDITYRYRVGLQRVFEQYPDTDLVAFIEDDDYYGSNYLYAMVGSYNLEHIKPPIIGMRQTYYYHLGVEGVQVIDHPDRSSMFTTCVTREVYENMRWPKDDYSFVDIEMWKQFRGLLIIEPRTGYLASLAMGMKGYGEGDLFGGSGHKNVKAYSKDHNMEFLKNVVDEESFEFYTKIKTN